MMRTMRKLASMAGGLAALLVVGCGGDSPTTNTNVSGVWVITCNPASEQCHNVTVTTGQNGDIASLDYLGLSGSNQGVASISGGTFFLNVNDLFRFRGTLDQTGNQATGTVTSTDFDGNDQVTPAIATRSR